MRKPVYIFNGGELQRQQNSLRFTTFENEKRFVPVETTSEIHVFGEVSVNSPFRYSVILWASVAGVVVFGERPDPWALVGTGIVMAAGLYTFFRERQLGLERGRR